MTLHTTPAWTSDASQRPSHRVGLDAKDPLSRVIWACTGDDPEERSALLVAQAANRNRTQPHFVWNPVDGDIIQMLPVGTKNRMYAPSSHASDCLAILVVGETDNPFTDGASVKGYVLARVFEQLGVPPVWPAGPVYSGSPYVKPLEPGHYSASQINKTHQGSGRIDINQLSIRSDASD